MLVDDIITLNYLPEKAGWGKGGSGFQGCKLQSYKV